MSSVMFEVLMSHKHFLSSQDFCVPLVFISFKYIIYENLGNELKVLYVFLLNFLFFPCN